jgi:hypothetical protein
VAPGLVTGFTSSDGPEQELVADAERLGILAEVHHQRPHHRRVAPADVAVDRVEVRQQAVAQPVERQHGRERLVLLVAAEVPHLAQRELAVRAQQAAERRELEPARVELAPLLDVLGLRVLRSPTCGGR